MATQLPNQNLMKFSLSKRGMIDFVFSKFAFLLFGVIITASLFYFVSIQKDLQQFDEIARTSEAIANVVGAASASPFEVSLQYKPNMNATLNLTENSFTITSERKSITHALYFPINNNGTFIMDNCLNITRTNITEVLECP